MITMPWWVLIVFAALIIAERWSTGYRDKLALKLYDISADRAVRYALGGERERLRASISGVSYRLANRLSPDEFARVEDLFDQLVALEAMLSRPTASGEG